LDHPRLHVVTGEFVPAIGNENERLSMVEMGSILARLFARARPALPGSVLDGLADEIAAHNLSSGPSV
jgi:hypothetical protein